MRVIGAVLWVVLWGLIGCTPQPDDEGLAGLFFHRGVDGGMLISSLDGKTEYLYNRDRVEEPYAPDATYFLPAALIALEDKAMADEKAILSWDGEERGLAEWNRDQTLPSAYRVSCEWFFEALAQTAGLLRIAERLQAMHYGNAKIQGGKESFWIRGPLEISAREQIAFLKALYRETLPVQKSYQKLLKSWMVVRTTKTDVLYAKTAWASRAPTHHGWNIGFVESQKRGTWFFALNMLVEQSSEAAFRQEIVMDALRLKGLLSK